MLLQSRIICLHNSLHVTARKGKHVISHIHPLDAAAINSLPDVIMCSDAISVHTFNLCSKIMEMRFREKIIVSKRYGRARGGNNNLNIIM